MAAALSLGLFAVFKPKSSSTATPPGSTSSGAPPPSAPPPPKLAPGLYPPRTPGAWAIAVQVRGGDGGCFVSASPGGTVGPNPGDAAIFWYGPGTRVTFRAWVDSGWQQIGTAFDHFEGPGVSTRASSFTATVDRVGYVNAVFAWFGQVG